MILQANISLILYSLFFLNIYENLKEKKNIILYLPIALTFFIYVRYSSLSYGLVDFALSIFFILSFLTGIKCINENNNEKLKNKFFIFLLFCTFCSTLKVSGIIIYIYVLFIMFLKRSFIFKNIKNYLPLFILIILFNSMWLFKNILNTSCLIYPINFLCFDLNIAEKNLDILQTVKVWAEIPISVASQIRFDDILTSILTLKNIITIFFFLFLFVIFCFAKTKLNKNFEVLVFSLLIFLNFQADALSGIYYNYFLSRLDNIKFTILKEVKILFLSNLVLIFYFIYRSDFSFLKFKSNISYRIYPLIFYTLSVLFWLLTAPNPRFGQHFFFLLLPVLFYFLNINYNFHITFNNFKKLFFLYLLISIFSMSELKKMPSIAEFFYFEIEPTSPAINKRTNFGFIPRDNNQNSCWLISNCYSSKKDVERKISKLGYKKYIIVNE